MQVSRAASRPQCMRRSRQQYAMNQFCLRTYPGVSRGAAYATRQAAFHQDNAPVAGAIQRRQRQIDQLLRVVTIAGDVGTTRIHASSNETDKNRNLTVRWHVGARGRDRLQMKWNKCDFRRARGMQVWLTVCPLSRTKVVYVTWQARYRKEVDFFSRRLCSVCSRAGHHTTDVFKIRTYLLGWQVIMNCTPG